MAWDFQRIRSWGWAAALLCSLPAVACGDSGSTDTNHNNQSCPEGYERQGPACTPVFDVCPGAAEVPMLGGGCQPIGVLSCATGFTSDGEGGCEPILPTASCGVGTMPVIGQTACQPVGISACSQGFASDGQGGCDPILPPGPCPVGTREVLGETTCQPIGDCGTTTWGNIVTDSNTVFVDQGYPGGGSDGSQGAPFVTVTEALAAVAAGGQVAVAEGDYAERLVIGRSVRLAGRCAALVTLRGVTFLGADRPAVSIVSAATDVEIRGVSVTGDVEGIAVFGATGVVLEDLVVSGSGMPGIGLFGESETVIRRVVVEQCAPLGVFAQGASVEIVDSVLRNNLANAAGDFGMGLQADCEPNTAYCGSTVLRRSVVVNNREIGVYAAGVDVTVEDSVVRDTLPVGTSRGGRGISVQCDDDVGVCGSLTVVGSVVERVGHSGIVVAGADASITSTVVRDVVGTGDPDWEGVGILVGCDSGVGRCGNVDVAGCLVERNGFSGFMIAGSDLTVSDTVVRGQLGLPDGQMGFGIVGECRIPGACPNLSVEDSLIEDNAQMGIVTEGLGFSLRGSVVRDTRPDGDGMFGNGVLLQCSNFGDCPSSLVESSLLERNWVLGVGAQGGDLTLRASVVREQRSEEATGYYGRGVSAQCSDVAGRCPTLTVEGSVISDNRDEGIFLGGGSAAVVDSVVRGTAGQLADGMYGRGIGAQCFEGLGCGSLSVSNSLIDGNNEAGLTAMCLETTVTDTVIRDSLPEESSGTGGRGIHAQLDPAMPACGALTVVRSLVSGNREVGIATFGMDTSVVSSHIRDTLPDDTDFAGRGFNAQCDVESGTLCGRVDMTETVVRNNRNLGLLFVGVSATLEGVAVLDSRTSEVGAYADDFGQGVFAKCQELPWQCGTLEVIRSLVDGAYSAGLAVQSTGGFLESSLIRDVLGRPLDGGFGYGIQVEGLPNTDPTAFHVRSCRVEEASLCGILYHDAGGLLLGTTVSGAEFAVVANVGSTVQLGEGNDLTGLLEDGLTWNSFEPSPAPPPTLPLGL